MLLEEKMAIFDWEANRNDARREGRAEGHTEERIELQSVYSWLFSQGRAGDVEKASNDPKFYEQVLTEYKNNHS